jgi:hypothetical protein
VREGRVLALCASNTRNVVRRTSEISSSSITCRAIEADVAGSGFAAPIAADEPLANENERLAAASTGPGLVRRFD